MLVNLMTMKLRNKTNQNKILILGGGGIIGREAVYFFLKKKFKVLVIDKKISKLNILFKKKNPRLKIYKKNIFSIKKNSKIFDKYYLIINCIGLNDHSLGINNPEIDVKTNIINILHIIKHFKNKKIIHLGTTHQYSGSMNKIKKFKETFSTDVQGISKNAVENYLIFYSNKYNFKLICLRIGNCFGNFQNGILDKKGLIFEILNSFLKREKFILYKKNIKKNFCYTPDVIAALNFLIYKNLKFPAIYNFIQYNISVENFVKKIIQHIKFGKFIYSKKKIKVNNYDFSRMRRGNFYRIFPNFKYTNIDTAIKKTLVKIKFK